jgi:hypothetical protein
MIFVIGLRRRRFRGSAGAVSLARRKTDAERFRCGGRIAGGKLQRRGAGRQTAQGLVVDAERGEYGEAATQRDDRGNHSRDQKTDVREHSTSHYGRARSRAKHASLADADHREADGAASTPAYSPASNGRDTN